MTVHSGPNLAFSRSCLILLRPVCVCVFVRVCVCTCMHVCTCMCVCACACICVCVRHDDLDTLCLLATALPPFILLPSLPPTIVGSILSHDDGERGDHLLSYRSRHTAGISTAVGVQTKVVDDILHTRTEHF